MDPVSEIFEGKTLVPELLLAYGFETIGDTLVYRTTLQDSGFFLTVIVSKDGCPSTQLLDPASEELYTLHLADGATGKFVCTVRQEYEEILTEISHKCCESEIFGSELTQRLIAYIRHTYGDQPEYLWEKFPNCAVWRRKDNRKWYAVLLTVQKHKLGLASREEAVIFDLRGAPEELETLIDGQRYFGGWHMNKKHWYTVMTDGSVSYEEICRRIDESYLLANGK